MIMNILVFKTKLEDIKQVRKLSHHLKNLQGVYKWNVDLQDCDKILRIEADGITPHSVEKVLQEAGYYCVELED
jgi:hypothetical protein